MTKPIDVLVIDDSATIRKLVELTLRGTAFRAHFALSGLDGIAQATRVLPAAILLDCVLPDVSGMEVCRRLAEDERTRAIPILLITARDASVRDEFRRYGTTVEFLGKPFTGPELLRRIAAVTEAPDGTVPERFAREHQERAARILYGRLRDGLAMIPSHMSRLGISPAGAYFAKRLLTPEVVRGVLDDLAELLDEIQPARHPSSHEPVAMPPSTVLDRAAGFSDRVRRARLSSSARRVLTLVDGKHSIAEISSRSGLDELVVGRLAHDLIEAGLLLDRTNAVRRSTRAIVILEPDVGGFQRPLASMLEARPEPTALVAVGSIAEVVETTRRDRPCLVLLNASQDRGAIGDAARELRADATLTEVALVAVLDSHDGGAGEDLYSAGFDAVLSKPIIFGDLERFIAPH